MLTAALMMIWAAPEVAAGIKKSVLMCLNVIIPSLFAFTVISKLLISTNIYSYAAAPFSTFSRKILRMPAEFMPVFIMSQTAGYPIGAALISKMQSDGRIDKKNAEAMLCFCISPGPAYIIAIAATINANDRFLWIKLFMSVILANCIALIITIPFRKAVPIGKSYTNVTFSSSLITSAVSSGAENMINICSMICFASALLATAEKLGIISMLTVFLSAISDCEPVLCYAYIKSFFDVSNLIYNCGLPKAAAALMSFGGICVFMQIKALCSNFSCLKAFFMRIPCAAAAYLICKLLTPEIVTLESVSVYSTIDNNIKFGKNAPIVSIFLLIMTILILSQKNIVKTQKI